MFYQGIGIQAVTAVVITKASHGDSSNSFLPILSPNGCLLGGFNPSETYEFVSWDDDIPNIRKNKNHVPNHQPGLFSFGTN
jgi:hypothetical protein